MPEYNLTKPKKYELINEFYARKLGKAALPVGVSNIKKNEITDLPVMMMADGTIVCIPKLPEMGVIAFVGLTGMGKTLSAGFIIDTLFHSWEDYIAVLNDSQDETFSWSEPNDNYDFQLTLRKINQVPRPLPMIYVFPNSDKFEVNTSLVENKNYARIAIPFSDVINNIEKYIDLGASEKYLMAKKQELLDVENEQQLFEVISSIGEGENVKGMAEVKNKIEKSFKTLLQEGILNLSDASIPSSLTVLSGTKEVYYGNPFTAIMKAECIPSFITSDLYTQKYKDAVLSYYIDLLFKESREGSMKGKRVWLWFDELTKVASTEDENAPRIRESLTNVAARGRNNSISLIYATQMYKKIPRQIREMTKFAIVFRHNSADEAKEICDDFGVDKSTREEIKKIGKYEAILFTTEHLVCYNKDKVWEEKGPLKGTIFPCLHKNRFLHKEVKK